MGPLSEQKDVEKARLQPGFGAGVFEVETNEVSTFFWPALISGVLPAAAGEGQKDKELVLD
jgi:hypothetical protein